MSSDVYADTEAEWAMALASDEGVRALCEVSPPGVVRTAWMLGHNKGRRTGLVEAQVRYADAMIQRDKMVRHTGTAEHDKDARGNPL
jgi:hypothetical protein